VPLRYCFQCQDMMDSRLTMTGTYMLEREGWCRLGYIRFRPCGHVETVLRRVDDLGVSSAHGMRSSVTPENQ
jgi:hypothetical protein